MLEGILSLLIALGALVSGHGVSSAPASPQSAAAALQAIEAVVARVSAEAAAVVEDATVNAPTDTGKPDLTGIDQARTHVTNERALQALTDAQAAKAAGQA
jgi:hypothetical protein